MTMPLLAPCTHTQGRVTFLEQPSSLELCLAPPADGSLQASQTASYSPGLMPGSVGWQLAKSVQLPPAFSDGAIHMFAGDTVVSAANVSAPWSRPCTTVPVMWRSSSHRMVLAHPMPALLLLHAAACCCMLLLP